MKRTRTALAAALLLAAPLARAQDAGVAATPAAQPSALRPSDDEARRLFEQAIAVLGEQRFAEAVPLFERSVSLREHPSALAGLAASYRGVGRYLRAAATLERLVAISTDATQEAEARAVLAECRRALAQVSLRVTGDPSEVLVDGERVGAGDLSRTMQLDPGAHQFEVRRMGYEPRREERRLGLGESAEVALDAAARPLPATLVVETPTSTTTIRVDGVPVGRGRHTLATSAGRHAVLVQWDDGHSQERVVELAPGTRMVVSINPNRPTSITSRWWFWAGVSAVAVGVVVGGVVLGQSLAGTDAPPTGSWVNVEALTAR